VERVELVDNIRGGKKAYGIKVTKWAHVRAESLMKVYTMTQLLHNNLHAHLHSAEMYRLICNVCL
jgi:hypothetical protein